MLAAAVALGSAAALHASNTSSDCAWPVNKIAMGGADVVAYFSMPADADGLKGSPELGVAYEGYTFWFVNESTRDTFKASPQKYVPAWGGFCAWGMAREGFNGNPSKDAEPGYVWNGVRMGPPCDPVGGWAIVEGRLLCSISRKYMNKFLSLGAEGVRDADYRWKFWYGALNAGPFNDLCWGPVDCPSRYNGCGNTTFFPNRTVSQ
eukprot:TRINITY_DN7939_c0_g1_i1.p1 TRINITY_DN7939_c0_g1~~TRINITY_DN7939_c0_g1_i1.p1  ORF type:complete len:206 (+),score=49.29 TRINITY_DN7939_c0_g1_i1:67-684(+)